MTPDQPDATLEQLYVQSLLLALANPYGFLPSQLRMVQNYLQEHAQLAKLTPVPPVHRMAKAVAIVPVGHDFPPFSANKGGAGEGTKMFLLTFDLAFELQDSGLALERQKAIPLVYREVKLDCAYRLDLLVEGCVVVEIKALLGNENDHEKEA